jgi:hypothetical protein
LPLDFLGTGWAGESLQAATRLKVPIALLLAVGLFFLVQSLIDRRDPKVSRAPEHPRDDSVEFK